jgi:APA family basic amino acid/polyamine antiporter
MEEIELQHAKEGKLLRILGVGFGIAVTIGGMIGVGILRTPGTIAAQLGNAWLVVAVWTLGGIYALLGTLSIAEIGISFPKAGGWYVYARHAFGDYVGFAVGWCDWLSFCAAMTLTAITIGESIAELIPAFSGSLKAIALTVLLIVGLLNWIGLRVGSRFQASTSLMKATGFLALVFACFAFGASHAPVAVEQNPHHLTTNFAAMFVAVIFSLQSVLYAYDSWYNAIYFTEEDRNPPRNLLRSMIGGVLSVMAIYLLANLALLYVLSLPQLAASSLPVASAARTIFPAYGGQLVSILAMLTLLSLLNSDIMIAPRLLFAMARDNLFSSKAALVNKGGTPVVGLLLTIVAALVLVITGTFEKLLSVTSFLFVLVYCSGFLAVLVLRKKAPKVQRPYKAWGFPWTPLTVLAISIVFLVGQVISDTLNSLLALIMVAISYPAFLMMRKPDGIRSFEQIWKRLQY